MNIKNSHVRIVCITITHTLIIRRNNLRILRGAAERTRRSRDNQGGSNQGNAEIIAPSFCHLIVITFRGRVAARRQRRDNCPCHFCHRRIGATRPSSLTLFTLRGAAKQTRRSRGNHRSSNEPMLMFLSPRFLFDCCFSDGTPPLPICSPARQPRCFYLIVVFFSDALNFRGRARRREIPRSSFPPRWPGPRPPPPRSCLHADADAVGCGGGTEREEGPPGGQPRDGAVAVRDPDGVAISVGLPSSSRVGRGVRAADSCAPTEGD